MTFGQKIKKLRLEKKMTQSELAEQLFVTRQAITNYERDANMPSIEVIKSMAVIFEVELSYLIGNIEDTKENQEETLVQNQEETENIKLEKKHTSDENNKKRFNTFLIITALTIIIFILICVTVKTNNKNYHLIGFYMSINEEKIYEINEIENESYCYCFSINGNEIKTNLDDFDNKCDSKYLGTLYYYQIYQKIGTNKFQINLMEQIDTRSRENFTIFINEKFFSMNLTINFYAPVEEVLIISYDEYNNILFEEKIYMSEDKKICSNRNISYGDFENYRVVGAARYYVSVTSDKIYKYNIFENQNILIFFYKGSIQTEYKYMVLFNI